MVVADDLIKVLELNLPEHYGVSHGSASQSFVEHVLSHRGCVTLCVHKALRDTYFRLSNLAVATLLRRLLRCSVVIFGTRGSYVVPASLQQALHYTTHRAMSSPWTPLLSIDFQTVAIVSQDNPPVIP